MPTTRGTGAPACSVVIATRDRPEQLCACLTGLRRSSVSPREVIVVDSAPARCAAAGIARDCGCHYSRVEGPGISRARNRGAELACGEVVAFLDDDAVPTQDWLNHLARPFDDPRVAAVGGRTIAGDDTGTVAVGSFDLGIEPRAVDRRHPLWFELANFGGLATGANLACRRDSFREEAGFDVRLGRGGALPGGEELHLLFRLIERGYQVRYVPAAIVHHPSPATPEVAERQQARDLALSAAYWLLLLAEHPRYRGRTLRYAAQALCGRVRAWRPAEVVTAAPPIPAVRRARCWVEGFWLYAGLRLAERMPDPPTAGS